MFIKKFFFPKHMGTKNQKRAKVKAWNFFLSTASKFASLLLLPIFLYYKNHEDESCFFLFSSILKKYFVEFEQLRALFLQSYSVNATVMRTKGFSIVTHFIFNYYSRIILLLLLQTYAICIENRKSYYFMCFHSIWIYSYHLYHSIRINNIY